MVRAAWNDDQTALVLKVKQGQKVKMNIKCADFSDGLKYCFAGGWMDLNGDKQFNSAKIQDDPANGEMLFFAGKLRAATPEFQTNADDPYDSLITADDALLQKINKTFTADDEELAKLFFCLVIT